MSYTLPDPITLERELRVFVNATQEYHATKLLIVTFAEEATFQRDGLLIEAVPHGSGAWSNAAFGAHTAYSE